MGGAQVSELSEATPFRDGEELLLGTGVALPRRAAPAHPGYLDRLARTGLAGFAFSAGLAHATVSSGIVDPAESTGFPLVEVPAEPPFVTVTKMVWRAIAADEYDALDRAYRAQFELIRAATGPDPGARLLAVLARELHAWALLVDGDGALRNAAPAAAVARLAAVRTQSRRLSESANRGIHICSIGGDEVVVQALRGEHRGRPLLAVGRQATLSSADRHLVNTAASMLAIVDQEIATTALADGRLRAGVLRLLTDRYVEAACYLAEQLGIELPAAPATLIVVVGTNGRLTELAAAVEAARGSEPVLLDTDHNGRLVLLLARKEFLLRQFSALMRRLGGLAAGTADVLSLSDLPRATKEADDAARAGRRRGSRVTAFADLGRGSLLALLEQGDRRAFADALLLPLVRHDASERGELVRSLRAWLERHGRWDAAAEQLGVHRHTLRHRIRKVGELVGRDLDSPGTRMDLWAALEIQAEAEADFPR